MGDGCKRYEPSREGVLNRHARLVCVDYGEVMEIGLAMPEILKPQESLKAPGTGPQPGFPSTAARTRRPVR